MAGKYTEQADKYFLMCCKPNGRNRNRCKIDNIKIDNFKIDNFKIDNFKIDKVQN